jgi:23S rRNA pseudouridine2605 synthase
LPQTAWLRRYRVRALGRVTQEALDKLRDGVTVNGMRYGAIEATFDREQGANVWLSFGIREGKNREVRNVVEHLGLKVNRLLRVSFGPFELGDLARGDVKELSPDEIRGALGDLAKGIDLDGPVLERETPSRKNRQPPARRVEKPREEKPHRNNPKKRRRDRTGGPRPKYPKDKD